MGTSFRSRPVYLAASWMGPVGRYTGKDREELTFLEMAEQCGQVFAGSPVRRRHIDAVVVGSQNPAAFSGVDNTAAKMSGILGISGVKSVLIDTASSSGASAFENAYLEVASGRHDHVLAKAVQKMSDASTLEATRIIAGVIDRNEAEYGLTMPACGALVARSLQLRLGLSDLEWSAYSALLSQRSHRFSSQNPDAICDSSYRSRRTSDRLPRVKTAATGHHYVITITAPCPTVWLPLFSPPVPRR